MVDITFSVDEDIHKKMKEHPEVNWTEILRQAIIDHLKKIEEIDTISIKDFKKRFDQELIKEIEKLDYRIEIFFYKNIKDMKKKRQEHLKEFEETVWARGLLDINAIFQCLNKRKKISNYPSDNLIGISIQHSPS